MGQVSGLVSKCGIDCGACPWGPYPRRGMTAEDFERYRNNAKRILGYMPIKTACQTCQTPDTKLPKGSKLPNRNCLIRQCVGKTGATNCAYCSRFPCETAKGTAGVWNREKIEAKLGMPLTEEEFHTFVEPFEAIKRLMTIRASLKQTEILEPAKAPTPEIRIADLPDNLPFPKKEIESFKMVHKLLTILERSSLRLRDTDTFAQHHQLEKRRAHVQRFLWILGRHGKLEKEKGVGLVLDAGTFEANRGSEKALAIWPFLKDNVFEVLSELGICCERIALKGVKEEDLVTGTGYLRSRGWTVKMSFREEIGGTAALKALQTLTQRLEEKHGKRAVQHLRAADMRILCEP